MVLEQGFIIPAFYRNIFLLPLFVYFLSDYYLQIERQRSLVKIFNKVVNSF